MIVFPMMGKSSRFLENGYDTQKYELLIKGKSVFHWVVSSFLHVKDEQPFLFIIRKDQGVEEFVKRELSCLGVTDYVITILSGDTEGQADSVYQGCIKLESKFRCHPLFIFNIDSIHKRFSLSAPCENPDGYLEVFEGSGDHWSFVEPGVEGCVKRTTEKVRVSNLCSNGLYYFKTIDLYLRYFEKAKNQSLMYKNEFYVAPIYNLLIQDGLLVCYKKVNFTDLEFCGVPKEYEELKKLYELGGGS